MANQVIITNGSGSTNLINGSYSVTGEVVGYDSTTIDPSSITVEEGTNNYNLTIAATGTLTLHVSEDGTSSGTPIVGATFKRCDSTGVEYGNVITTDSSGNAVFNNVPYAATSAPTIYYKQLTSDGEHEFVNTLQSTTMNTSTDIVEVTNSLGAVRTISLTDANYLNLPIESGTITLTN